MKRLCALIGFTCFAVLTAVFYFGNVFMWVIMSLSAVLLIVTLIIPKTRKEKTLPVGFLTALLACLWFLSYTAFFVKPLQDEFADREGRLVVKQKSAMYYNNDYYCYETNLESIDSEEVDAGLLVMSREPFYSDPGDTIIFESKLIKESRDAFLGRGNKFRTYVFDTSNVRVSSPENRPLSYYISELNFTLKKGLWLELPLDEAKFSTALLLGDRYALEPETNDLFRTCGITHIVVVSGLHLAIITSLVKKLTHKLIKNRFISTSVLVASVLLFAALTGFGFSVRRAMIVQLAVIIGGVFRRRADPLNSLGLSAILIILPNPYAAFDVGFQLSLLSTVGILTLSDRMLMPVVNRLSAYKIMKFKPISALCKIVLGTFFASLSAALATAPISILVFKGFSLVSIFVNILIVPIMTIVLVLAALCSVLHYLKFFPLLADTCAFFLEILYGFIISVCSFFSKIPYSYVRTDEIYFTYWIGATVLLVAFAIYVGKRRIYVLTVLLSLLILFSSSGVYKLVHKDRLTLIIPDTGGLSVILKSTEGHCVLTLDGNYAKSYALINELEKLPNLDSDVIISSGEKEADNYLKNALYEFDYPNVLRYDKDNNSDVDGIFPDTEIKTFSEDYCVNLWDKAEVFLFVRNECFYEYVSTDYGDVLILPENSDGADIPEDLRNPEIVVMHRLPNNLGLISCDTLIVVGDGYMSEATAGIAAGIAKEVVLDSKIVYDIN